MVSLIDVARTEHELFVRDSLELAALMLFLRKYGVSDLAELEKYIALRTEASAAGKTEEFYRYDNMFHHIFFSSREAVENTRGHYYRIRFLSIRVISAGRTQTAVPRG